jgi:hypothetical protein
LKPLVALLSNFWEAVTKVFAMAAFTAFREIAMGIRIIACWLVSATFGLCHAAALADDLTDIDSLSRATEAVAPGLELARSQSADGDLLAALATLERINIAFPNASEAQLLHASLLCRLDDKAGAATELAHLKRRDYARNIWDEANAACAAPVPLTAAPQKAEPTKVEPTKTEPPKPQTGNPAPKPRRRIDGI